MILSAGKVGTILPDEKKMIDEKASTLIDLAKSSARLFDKSLNDLEFTKQNLLTSVMNEDD